MMHKNSNLRYTSFSAVPPQDLFAERMLVARLIPYLSWRRHGIGCLQAYVKEGKDELRVHIWHPDIVRPGIEDQGDIHDHRFAMTSTILYGSIEHTEYELQDGTPVEDTFVWPWNGDVGDIYDVYQVLHARADLGARYEQVPGPLEGKNRVVRAVGASITFGQGEMYHFERGAFHRTRPHGLAVTLVHKYAQLNHKAQILAKHGTTPVHAFEPDERFDALQILADAVEALQLEVG